MTGVTHQRRDFGRRPLIAGTILGVRTWHVEQPTSPRLHGSVHPVEWSAGENVARCIFANALIRRILKGDDGDGDHDLLSLDCTCGFYAYFDGVHAENYRDRRAHNVGVDRLREDATDRPRDERERLLDERDLTGTCDVVGVIEGYGRIVVGDKGFRAEKARILAIARPDVPLGISSSRRYWDNKRTIRTEGAFDALIANYPRAAVFSTVDAMLGEFPLTDPADLDAAVGS